MATSDKFLTFFTSIDENGDGLISQSEYAAALRRAGARNATDAAGAKVIAEYDKDGDGHLSYTEFTVLATDLQQKRNDLQGENVKIGFLYKMGRAKSRWWRHPWARRTFVLTKEGRLRYYYTNKVRRREWRWLRFTDPRPCATLRTTPIPNLSKRPGIS